MLCVKSVKADSCCLQSVNYSKLFVFQVIQELALCVVCDRVRGGSLGDSIFDIIELADDIVPVLLGNGKLIIHL